MGVDDLGVDEMGRRRSGMVTFVSVGFRIHHGKISVQKLPRLLPNI